MEDVKRRNKIEQAIKDYEKRVKDLSVYISDISEQERFFRNSEDKYLYLTIEGELRIAKVRKESHKAFLRILNNILK